MFPGRSADCVLPFRRRKTSLPQKIGIVAESIIRYMSGIMTHTVMSGLCFMSLVSMAFPVFFYVSRQKLSRGFL
jgi:hypothetical protein